MRKLSLLLLLVLTSRAAFAEKHEIGLTPGGFVPQDRGTTPNTVRLVVSISGSSDGSDCAERFATFIPGVRHTTSLELAAVNTMFVAGGGFVLKWGE
jgi:hypothetical protein